MKKFFSSPSTNFSLTFFNGGGFISEHSIQENDIDFFKNEIINEPLLSIYDSKLFFKAPTNMLQDYLKQFQKGSIINCKRLLEKNIKENTFDFLFYEEEKFLSKEIENIEPNSLITFRVKKTLVNSSYVIIREGIFLGVFYFVFIKGTSIYKEKVYLADVNGEIEFIEDIFSCNDDEEIISNINIFNSYENIFNKFHKYFYFSKKINNVIPLENATFMPFHTTNFKDSIFILENIQGLSTLKKVI